MPRLLFRTLHGSHLYDLATTASDTDWYEVWSELPEGDRIQHFASDEDDSTRVSLPEFLRTVGLGVPQAIEALFAPDRMVQVDEIRFLRSALVPGTASLANFYSRSIRDHSCINPTPKRRRHSARLAHDLSMFLERGYIDTTAFSRTNFSDIALYQDGMPELSLGWQANEAEMERL